MGQHGKEDRDGPENAVHLRDGSRRGLHPVGGLLVTARHHVAHREVVGIADLEDLVIRLGTDHAVSPVGW